MKNWKSSLAAVALLCVALFAGRVGDVFTPGPSTTVCAQAAAAISAMKAPAPMPILDAIPVGRIVQLSFTDLTAEVARKSHIDYYPRPTGAIFFPAVGLNGDVVIFISAPTAGRILVWIDSPGDDGRVEHAETELTFGEPVPPVNAPVITSPLTATGRVGVAFSYAIAATGSPTSFATTGLLEGLTLDAKSGLIAGTPTASGTSQVKLSATNASGTGTATLALTIDAAPPPPVAQKVQVIVVEETADSTPAYARIRNSAAIRNWAENGGHRVYFIDQDSRYTGDGADRWKSWQDRARAKGVPFVFVTPIADGTRILAEGPEPTSEQAFLELVQKYGGKGQTCKLDSGNPTSCPVLGGTR